MDFKITLYLYPRNKTFYAVTDMNLQQLEYIVAVSRVRHFAKAADQCGVTQPTLSAMIQKLENELGVKLFERTSQQVSLTPIGQKVVAQAEEVLAHASLLRDVVEEEKHSLSGTFRLGVLPTIAPYLIPRFFPLLRRQHPETDLRVAEMQTEALYRAMHEGELDAAILVKLGERKEFDQQTLYYEQFFAYVARGSKLAQASSIRTEELQHEFLWLLDEGHCFRDQLVKFCRLKSAQESKKAYTLGSIETFMRMVEGGQGVTFIPELALEQLTPSQRELVRPFALPVPTREVVLATPHEFVRHALLELIRQAVVACVPPHMLSLRSMQQRV